MCTGSTASSTPTTAATTEPCVIEWNERINYPHVRRGGPYFKDRIELRNEDIIVLCYNPKRGPYVELSLNILDDC